MSKRNEITQVRCTGDEVGQIRLIGQHCGAIVNYYQVTKVDGFHTHLKQVFSESVRNQNGTFSTVYR